MSTQWFCSDLWYAGGQSWISTLLKQLLHMHVHMYVHIIGHINVNYTYCIAESNARNKTELIILKIGNCILKK